jgi:hypothetical protein
MNNPEFLIHGIERRKLKKKLAEMKQFLRMFNYYNDIDIVYGGGIDEEEKEKRLLEVQKEVNKIEFNLSLKNNR